MNETFDLSHFEASNDSGKGFELFCMNVLTYTVEIELTDQCTFQLF